MTTMGRAMAAAVLASIVLVGCSGRGDGEPTAISAEAVPAENQKPVADAGPAQSVLLSRPVTLDGSASTDPDRDTLTYSWTITSRPAGSASVLSGVDTPRATFAPDLAGRYVIALTVSDGQLTSTPSAVTVDAASGNVPPVANAGATQVVATGATVTLDGSASSDANGDLLRYSWTLTQRPAGSTASLSSGSAVNPTFVADQPGTFEATLTVTDTGFTSAPAQTQVTAVSTVQNQPPVAAAGADNATVVGRAVTLDGSGSSDVNGDAITYSWTLTGRPAGSNAALMGAQTVRPALVPDQAGLYVATLIVSDGRLSSAPSTVVVTATSPAVLPTHAYIRAGGGSVTTLDGRTYEADGYYTGGSAGWTTSLISGTPDDALYQRERWGEFSYSVPLADGDYQVTLFLTELYGDITGSGQRVFDVRFETGEAGEQTVATVDVWAAVGPNAAYEIDRVVTVSGGRLDIQFLRKVQQPKVGAIAAVPLAEVKPRPARIPMLRQKAIRLLAGQGAVNCANGGAVEVKLTESALVVGSKHFLHEALTSVSLSSSVEWSPTSSMGTESLWATLEYLVGVDRDAVTLVLGAEGLLQAVKGAGVDCRNPPYSPWGSYDGRPRPLVNGVEKPRPSYPQVTMTCNVNNYMAPGETVALRLIPSNYRLRLERLDGSLYDDWLTWMDPSLPPGPFYPGYTIRLDASAATTLYHDEEFPLAPAQPRLRQSALTTSSDGTLSRVELGAYKYRWYTCTP